MCLKRYWLKNNVAMKMFLFHFLFEIILTSKRNASFFLAVSIPVHAVCAKCIWNLKKIQTDFFACGFSLKILPRSSDYACAAQNPVSCCFQVQPSSTFLTNYSLTVVVLIELILFLDNKWYIHFRCDTFFLAIMEYLWWLKYSEITQKHLRLLVGDDV